MSNVLRGLVVDQNGYNQYREVYGPSWRRSGLGWWDDGRVSSVPRDAQWVRLVLDIGEEPITILLEREEDGP